MGLYNTTNVKNLPQVDQVTNTDFLVVENYNGTNKIRFKDFVIGPINASFYDSFKTNMSELSATGEDLTTDLATLSGEVQTNTANLTYSANKLNNDIEIINTVTIPTLSSTVENFTTNIAITAFDLIGKVSDIQGTFPAQYHQYYNIQWPNLWGNNSLIGIHYFTSVWEKELNSDDILYVRQSKFRLNGTDFRVSNLYFTISTVFFTGNGDPSTYALIMTATDVFPQSFRVGYIPPGFTNPVTPADGYGSIEFRIFAVDQYNPFDTTL